MDLAIFQCWAITLIAQQLFTMWVLLTSRKLIPSSVYGDFFRLKKDRKIKEGEYDKIGSFNNFSIFKTLKVLIYIHLAGVVILLLFT